MSGQLSLSDQQPSAFFGLKKRSERQFREERVHRLLVPALFLALTSSLLNSLAYFSKLSPNCQEFYDRQNIRNHLKFTFLQVDIELKI